VRKSTVFLVKLIYGFRADTCPGAALVGTNRTCFAMTLSFKRKNENTKENRKACLCPGVF